MVRTIPYLIAMAAPLAVQARQYEVAAELLVDDCFYPADFAIQRFAVWTPATGNSNTTRLGFVFADKDTGIETPCRLNATSKNVSPSGGAAPRYQCDSAVVEFIWQDQELTVLETACPGQSSNGAVLQASGSVTPSLHCNSTDCDFVTGDGTLCSAPDVTGNFTSLEPPPP